MKQSILVLIAATSLIVACSKDTPSSPGNGTGSTSSTNSFNVTGGIYSNSSFKGFVGDTASSASDITGSAFIVFAGLTDKTNESFSFSIQLDSTLIQQYDMSPAYQKAMTLSISNGSGSTTYVGSNGQVNLTKWDAVGGRAKGTFNGSFIRTGSFDTFTVTDGKFDIKRTY